MDGKLLISLTGAELKTKGFGFDLTNFYSGELLEVRRK